jgi:hypothetical protein
MSNEEVIAPSDDLFGSLCVFLNGAPGEACIEA